MLPVGAGGGFRGEGVCFLIDAALGALAGGIFLDWFGPDSRSVSHVTPLKFAGGSTNELCRKDDFRTLAYLFTRTSTRKAPRFA